MQIPNKHIAMALHQKIIKCSNFKQLRTTALQAEKIDKLGDSYAILIC